MQGCTCMQGCSLYSRVTRLPRSNARDSNCAGTWRRSEPDAVRGPRERCGARDGARAGLVAGGAVHPLELEGRQGVHRGAGRLHVQRQHVADGRVGDACPGHLHSDG